jgi:hypothetical protein
MHDWPDLIKISLLACSLCSRILDIGINLLYRSVGTAGSLFAMWTFHA